MHLNNDHFNSYLLDLLRERTRHSKSDLSQFYTYASVLEMTTLLDWIGKTAGERASLITVPDDLERLQMVKIIDNICTPFIKTIPLEFVSLVNVDGFVSNVTQRVVQKYVDERMQATMILIGRANALVPNRRKGSSRKMGSRGSRLN